MMEIEQEGKNVKEAIEAALKKLQVKKEDVEIKVVDEGKAGLFGLMGASPARVKVKLLRPPQAPGEPEVPGEEELSTAQERVKEALQEILRLMGMKGEVKTSVMAGRVHAEIFSPDGALLIGKKGQALDSLQLIINTIINRALAKRIKVALDVEGYRGRREDALTNLARRTAERVKHLGHSIKIDPLPPQERRIIHITLEKDPQVRTESEGEEFLKSILVSLKES